MNQQQLELQRDLYRLLLRIDEGRSDVESVLATALELVVKITNARIGYIELRNREGKIWWSAYHCDESEKAEIQKRISTGIIAESIKTGETIVTPSAFLDSRFDKRDSVHNERIEAVLCSPFQRDGIVGVIYLQGDSKSKFNDSKNLMETELFAKHITPILSHLRFQVESRLSVSDFRKKYDLSCIIGESSILMSRLQDAMVIAELDVNILITGETGSGKGMLAKAIHANSLRKNKPFVHLNCANLPEPLAESELFGSMRGSHSSALTDVKGKIAAAKGGTIFLDEVGELPITVQAKLLQFLEDGSYFPLGGTVPVSADVRVIAATNTNFESAISNGKFREDLYYRLCIFPIEMPSLKQRKDDIPVLVKHFLEKYCTRFNIPTLEIDNSALLALQECDWNGNVRQLENKIQHGILRARATQTNKLFLNHFLPENRNEYITSEIITYREGRDDWERRFITMNLEKYEWNVSETAKTLGLSRSQLNNLICTHNLERKIPDEV